MSSLVYPTLSGMDINVKRTPIWSTEVLTSESGKELRAAWWTYPRYRFQLTYNYLRQDSNGDELATLEGFFHRMRGQFDNFLFADPKDSSATLMPFAKGDDATLAFQLQRTSVPSAQLPAATSRAYWPAQGDGYEPITELNGAPTIFRTDWQGTYQLYATPRTNLITYSEQLDNAAYTKNNVTVSANAIQAPDGTMTADKIVETATTSPHTIVQAKSVTSGTPYTLSVHAKAAGRTMMRMTEGNTLTSQAWFDLQNGVVAGVTGNGSPSASIKPLGDGWYRCSLTYTTGASQTVANAQWGPSTGYGDFSYAGDITKGIYTWGAKFEPGSVATSYFGTTTTAVTVTDYTISATGLVTLSSALATGNYLSWTGSYYYRVRFEQDELEFDREFSRIWNGKTVKLISVK